LDWIPVGLTELDGNVGLHWIALRKDLAVDQQLLLKEIVRRAGEIDRLYRGPGYYTVWEVNLQIVPHIGHLFGLATTYWLWPWMGTNRPEGFGSIASLSPIRQHY
jgi:hypothetical protein